MNFPVIVACDFRQQTLNLSHVLSHGSHVSSYGSHVSRVKVTCNTRVNSSHQEDGRRSQQILISTKYLCVTVTKQRRSTHKQNTKHSAAVLTTECLLNKVRPRKNARNIFHKWFVELCIRPTQIILQYQAKKWIYIYTRMGHQTPASIVSSGQLKLGN